MEPLSENSMILAGLLCFFIGTFGIHRFYVGKIMIWIPMVLELGGLGIWVLFDFVAIILVTSWVTTACRCAVSTASAAHSLFVLNLTLLFAPPVDTFRSQTDASDKNFSILATLCRIY